MNSENISLVSDDYTKYLKYISKDGQIAHDYRYASVCLTKLIQLRYLNYSDIIDHPEKFFDAHLKITNYEHLEGFSIKFTVQFNLFAGSIVTLGTESQKKMLMDSQNAGHLGCFLLTEYSTGVTSGLIVNTEAEIIGDDIVINTPQIVYDDLGQIDFEKTIHRKNWISQGLSAKYGIVIAQLFDTDEIPIGPHLIKKEGGRRRLGIYPFLIDMDDANIYKKDNGTKTGINGLDNAQIVFRNLKIRKDQILFDDLENLRETARNEGLGTSPQLNPNTGFMRIATRLNSGRLCIADSLLGFVTKLVQMTRDGPLSKQIYLDKKTQIKLSNLPEIQDTLNLIDHRLLIMRRFIDNVKLDYCKQIKNRQFNGGPHHPLSIQSTATQFEKDEGQMGSPQFNLSSDLIEKIMVAKILSINYGLDIVGILRQKMGSNSLFAKNNLGSNLDILLCGRFAEGDNDLLIIKLVCDRLKKLTHDGMVANFFRLNIFPVLNSIHQEQYQLLKLGSILTRSAHLSLALAENYQLVKSCAELICYNILFETRCHLSITDLRAML